MSNAPKSRTRLFHCNALPRPRVLVPVQSVPRRVIIQATSGESVFISVEDDERRRQRPEQLGNIELSPSTRLEFALAAGQQVWVLTRLNVAPAVAVVEYPWEPDPNSTVSSEDMVVQANPRENYDELADDPFKLDDDPLAKTFRIADQVPRKEVGDEEAREVG